MISWLSDLWFHVKWTWRLWWASVRIKRAVRAHDDTIGHCEMPVEHPNTTPVTKVVR